MNKSNGFTLPEVLVSLGILTVGIVLALTTSVVAFRGNERSRDLVNAQMIMESFLEEFGMLPYDHSTFSDDGDSLDLGDTDDPDHSTTITCGNKEFTVLWNVVENHGLDSLGNLIRVPSLKTISVFVIWDNHQISVTTLKSREG